jgi:transposase
MARQLVAEEIVSTISPETVRNVLRQHQLRPWRWHAWLSHKVPRDDDYLERVRTIVDLYTRPLATDEQVLCVDEKTSLQPRRRHRPTRPARPGSPLLLEHEYARGGALNLFAAFDTRSGGVFGVTARRKRAVEFVAFLEAIEARTAPHIRTIHIVLDNLRVHKGRLARAWLADHPRIVLHFPPVHCSWINQVEQWFGIIQRKLLRLANYADCEALADAIAAYIARWNEHAHPFNWRTSSLTRVMATAQCNPNSIPTP